MKRSALTSGSKPSTTLMLLALIVGAIAAILDTTIVAIGMRTLTVELRAPLTTIQWVSTGYLLSLAVTIPFVGWAQARIGGKRLWLLALGLFVLGSALCGFAWNAPALIGFRLLQGIGGGIMLPLMQTLAMQHVPAERRARVMAAVSLPAALGPILGPVLGGMVLNWFSWRWMFLINVPIGVVGLVLAALFLVDDRANLPENPGRLDLVGAVLLTPALAGLLFGLSNTHNPGGFARPDVLVPGVLGLVLLAAFAWWAHRRSDRALVDVSLLKVPTVRSSTITLTFLGVALFAGTFLLPLYFQSVRGYSVLAAGVLLIPQGVGTLLSRVVAGHLVERLGARLVAVVGFLVIAAATIPFAWSGTDTGLWLLGVVLFVRGLGLGVVFIPVMTAAYLDIGSEQMPQASAITRIVQQLGGAFGTALVAVVLTGVMTVKDSGAGFAAAFWVTIGATLLAALPALLLPGRTRPEPVHEDRQQHLRSAVK